MGCRVWIWKPELLQCLNLTWNSFAPVFNAVFSFSSQIYLTENSPNSKNLWFFHGHPNVILEPGLCMKQIRPITTQKLQCEWKCVYLSPPELWMWNLMERFNYVVCQFATTAVLSMVLTSLSSRSSRRQKSGGFQVLPSSFFFLCLHCTCGSRSCSRCGDTEGALCFVGWA